MKPRTMPTVSAVIFSRAHHLDRQRGLRGWTSFLLDDALVVEGVAIRRSRDGVLSLSFPEPVDRKGKRRRPVRPVDEEARLAIERQVLSALAREYGGSL